MGSWIYALSVSLLVPFIMIVFGGCFILVGKVGPKKINAVFGYRSARSMKNKETWAFAHFYCGKLWWLVGWIMLLISLVIMFALKEISITGIIGALLSLKQLAFLVLTIILTERALRKEFDEDGYRRC